MPKLGSSVSQDGLEVPILIGLDGQEITDLLAAGQAVPAPILIRGLLDTGSDVAAVAPWVLRALAVTRKAQATTHTAGGQIPVHLFRVSLTLLPAAKQTGQGLTLPSVWVSELAVTLPDADMLVGLNVLLQCKLLLYGPARNFSLDF